MQLLLFTLGDPDYDRFFDGNKEGEHWFTIPAHIFYALFLILVSLAFMNLLIGLSVSDIEVRMVKDTKRNETITFQILESLNDFFSRN